MPLLTITNVEQGFLEIEVEDPLNVIFNRFKMEVLFGYPTTLAYDPTTNQYTFINRFGTDLITIQD